MEFGALQCKPMPDCTVCPLKSRCVAFHLDRVSDFPYKSKKQGQRTRYFNYLVILSGKGKNRSVFLNKRTEKDIWRNLFDFPMIETEKAVSLKKLVLSKEWKDFFHDHKIITVKESKTWRHILSHQVILAKFYQVEIPATVFLPFLKVNMNKIDEYPVPRLVEKYLEECGEVVRW
jgi:A/G-specific adenine glycosylase